MNTIPKIIVSGPIVVDTIMNFSDRYSNIIKPDRVNSFSVSLDVNEISIRRGGVGANIVYSLTLLNEKPGLVGSVGFDSRKYIQKLSKLGVDTTGVHFSRLQTASYHVISDSENNQVGGLYHGAMSDNEKLSFKNWESDKSFFVISPDEPKLISRLINECKKNRARMLFDFGQQVIHLSEDILLNGIKSAEIIIANDFEMSFLSEKLKLSHRDIINMVPIVITTYGSKGSIIESKNFRKIKIKSTKTKNVVDTTGAGDAYRAGFLYGYIRNWNIDICGKMGSVMAAYSVESYGSQEHFFNLKQFCDRFYDNYSFYPKL